MDVSVVIPTYQRRDVVMDAIASACAQTRPPLEVIVVDDGSTDGTADAVRTRFGSRVVVVEQPNRGPSAARNNAIDHARGDVIAFLDSDNEWLPHHLAAVGELLDSHPECVLAGTHRRYRFGADGTSAAIAEDLAEPLISRRDGVGCTSSVAVRRQAFIDAGGFDERLWFGEDMDLYLRLSLLGRFAIVSMTTLVKGYSADSLEERGRREGLHVDLFDRCAENLLPVLARTSRADADHLRAVVRVRRIYEAVHRRRWRRVVRVAPGLLNPAGVAAVATLVRERRRQRPGRAFWTFDRW